MGCRFRFLLLYILQYDSAAYQPYQNNLAAALYLILQLYIISISIFRMKMIISFSINSVHYSTQCRSKSLQ